jgi:hypothetical protein
MRRSNEPSKQRMWLVWFAVKFRMELAGNIEWMFFQFDHFNELSFRRGAADDKS